MIRSCNLIRRACHKGAWVMGEVIRLRPRQEVRLRPKTDAENGVEGGGGAEILLFLGVRYERHDGPDAVAAKGHAKRGKNRKRA